MLYFLTASHSSCCSLPCCPVLVPTASISPWWRGVLQPTVGFHCVGNAIVELLSHVKCRTPLYPVSHPTCAICLWRCELGTYFRTRWSGLKLHQERFSWGVRKTFFIERLVKQWNRLLREAVESPSWTYLKSCRCGTLGHSLVADLTVWVQWY